MSFRPKAFNVRSFLHAPATNTQPFGLKNAINTALYRLCVYHAAKPVVVCT